MENREIDLVQLAKVVWESRKKIIKWTIAGFVIGAIVAISIPRKYETIVKIAPEGSSGTKMSMGSMSGLAAMAGFDIGGVETNGVSEKIYPEIIRSTPFVLEFANIDVEHKGRKISFYEYITDNQKYPWWSYIVKAPVMILGWTKELINGKTEKKDTINIFRPSELQEAFVLNIQALIKAEVDKKSSIITIRTTMQDPVIAATISDSLLVKLQRYMTDYRTKKSRDDLDMNAIMFEEAKAKYYEADSIYNSALDRNQNLISQYAKAKIKRLENEKMLAFSVYQQLATQVEMSKLKLQEDTPIATIIEPASVALRAKSPNKKIIAAGFAFLGLIIASGLVIIKQLSKKEDEN